MIIETHDHFYNFGKKIDGAEENVISQDELDNRKLELENFLRGVNND